MRADVPRALIVLRAAQLALVVAGLSLYAGLASLAASPIRQLTVTSTANLRPAWSPDAKRIAFQRSEGEGQYHVYVMDADGGNPRRVTSGDVDDRHPAWSPDGRSLAVDSGTGAAREIWIVDVAGGRRRQVTTLGASASFPSWSPDGARIAFYAYRDGVTDLWVVSREGGPPERLTQGLASEQRQQCTFACHGSSWSPRGDRIAYSALDNSRVVVGAPVPGSGTTTVSPDDERAHFPVYLADGRLVYVSEHITLDQSWTDLWVQPLEDNAARQPLASGVQAQGPFDLSSDGRQLLFASPRSGNFEIYAVTLDDAGKAALAERTARGAGRDGDRPAVPSAGASVARQPASPFGDSAPYLLGIGAVALIGIGIELLVRARRLRR